MQVESPAPRSLPGRRVDAALRRRLEDTAAKVYAPSLVGVIIAVGLLLRLVRYLHYRSLWIDEAMLALNVTSRSYTHLVGRLDFDQGAPVGFLVFEKLAVSIFGDSERAFRLFPFLASLAAVFVFWRVASRFLDRHSAVLALVFFAILEPFVYYSAETRPYAFDVLTALVLVWLFDRALTTKTVGSAVAFGVVGIVTPWLSYGSLFVLAGTGVTLLTVTALERNMRAVVVTLGAIVVWLVSFGIEYWTSIRHLKSLASGVRGINAESGSVVKHTYIIFSEPGAFNRTLDGLTVVLVVVGAIALARMAWPRLAALVVTLIAVLLVGQTHRYPVDARFILYLLALALPLFALGAVSLVRSTQMPARAVIVGTIAVLLVIPGWLTLRNIFRLPTAHSGTPAILEPAKEILGQLASRWRPGDTLYVSVKSTYAFRYYLTCDDCNVQRGREFALWPFAPIGGPTQDSPAFVPKRSTLVAGTRGSDLNVALDDFDRLRGRSRVWFLFLHTPPLDEGTLEFYLSREGRQVAAIRAGRSAALLYDLSRPPKRSATASAHG